MSNPLTSRLDVLAEWPTAHIWPKEFWSYIVNVDEYYVIPIKDGHTFLGRGKTVNEAWVNAARNLPHYKNEAVY